MYIIEKILKFYLKLKKKEENIIIPEFDDNYELEDVITCKHNFIAIDSTGKVFACSKCGYLIKKERFNKQNNFKIT